MKKEATQKSIPVVSISQVMEKYDAAFSFNLREGFAHVKIINDQMFVTFLNEDGYEEDADKLIALPDIERVANFMKEMKELRLPEYKK